jgi:spore maturation protein CgeB
MIDETILFLTYYSRPQDREHRILKHIIGSFCGAYLPFDLYLSSPLEKIFSNVIVYDFLRRRAELGLRAMNEEVLALVKEARPKYVLWTSFYDDIRKSTLEAIRKHGTNVVGWFFDDEWRFRSYSKYWIPYLDYCVTNAISAVPEYRQLGARVLQTIPNTGIGVDVDWAHLDEERDLSFVGSIRTSDRRRYVEELAANDIPVEVFGEGSGGYIPFQRMLDIFRTSRINLNFSKTLGHRGPRQIKGRVFQVCMAGGFLLTEYAPGIEKYFELGREIVCFDGPREMVDKARYYLTHEAERRAIAGAGWERAKSAYSSSSMVERVFKEIEEDLAKGAKDRAPVARLKPSFPARRVLATYHLVWGRAQVEEKDPREFWVDDLALGHSYVPWYLWGWVYRVLGWLPWSARLSVFRMVHRLENKRFGVDPQHWLTLKSSVRRRTKGFLRRLRQGRT